MTYRCKTWNSIQDVDSDDWNDLKRGPHDIFMDIRFICAIEKGTAEESQFRYLIFYDEQDHPVASCCLSSVFSYYQLDSSMQKEGWRRRCVDFVNRFAPSIMHGTIVLCGLPISGVGSQLQFAGTVRRPDILQQLDETIRSFARELKAESVSLKEFTQKECGELEHLAVL